MMHIEKLNVKWLKDNCKMIHYFGLGFIQLKLDESSRMHFYNAVLPRITPEEEVHNHRYDFRSWVLDGRLIHEVYGVVDTGRNSQQFVIDAESCGSGSVPVDYAPKLCTLKKIHTSVYAEGSDYSIDNSVFHKVYSTRAITYLERGPVIKTYAKVIRPRYAEKVCPFSKSIPEQQLWEIVEVMVGNRI